MAICLGLDFVTFFVYGRGRIILFAYFCSINKVYLKENSRIIGDTYEATKKEEVRHKGEVELCEAIFTRNKVKLYKDCKEGHVKEDGG